MVPQYWYWCWHCTLWHWHCMSSCSMCCSVFHFAAALCVMLQHCTLYHDFYCAMVFSLCHGIAHHATVLTTGLHVVLQHFFALQHFTWFHSYFFTPKAQKQENLCTAAESMLAATTSYTGNVFSHRDGFKFCHKVHKQKQKIISLCGFGTGSMHVNIVHCSVHIMVWHVVLKMYAQQQQGHVNHCCKLHLLCFSVMGMVSGFCCEVQKQKKKHSTCVTFGIGTSGMHVNIV